MSVIYTQSFKQCTAAPNSDANFIPDVGLAITFCNTGPQTPGRRANTTAFMLGNTTGSFANHLVYWLDPLLQHSGALVTGKIIVGFAVNITHSFNHGTLCNLYNGSSALTTSTGDPGLGNGPQLAYDGAGHFYVNNTTNVLTVPTTGSAWYYIELENNSAGNYTVRIDGVQVYSASNWVASGGIKGVHWYAPPTGNGFAQMIQDVVVMDGNGSVNNTFIGDCRVEGITVSTTGALAEQVSGATSTMQTPNGDTSYAVFGAVGQRATFNMTAPANTSGTIAAVVVKSSAKKTSGTPRTIKGVVRVGGTVYESSVAKDPQLQSDYNEVDFAFDTNPNTGAAWTTAAASALEAGMKLAS